MAHAQIQSVLPNRYARGWHCFGLERNFKKGQVASLEAFGTKLVAFRLARQEVTPSCAAA